LAVWVRFRSDQRLWGGIIFHSDDSRYVLLTGGEYPKKDAKPIPLVTGRAGGNRRAIDTFYGTVNFPEVTVKIDETVPLSGNTFNEWHLLCLTWQGYPEGRLHLYVDDRLVGESIYDHRHDNHYRLADKIAIGYRPRDWLGELVQNEDGTLVDLRPETTAPVSNSGMEVHGLRLYSRALTDPEIAGIMADKP
jgi:hypothetical protein